MAISSYKDLVVFPNDNSGRVNIKEQVFTTSGTWTAPAGVSSAQVILVGAGGGGGGGSQYSAGGGGAGGAVVVQNLSVTPGTAYPILVGAGGQGGLGALTAASDTTSTLPGTNGGTTTFGSVTVWNYLTNPDFDLNVLGWDPEVIYRGATGISGQSSIEVFPNANGIVVGQYVYGGSAVTTASPEVLTTTSGLGSNTQVSSVVGNIVNLTVANSGAVSGIIRFDNGDSTIQQGQILFYQTNQVGIDALSGTNTTTNNTYSSNQSANLSNNLLAPRLAQLEDTTLVSNSLIQQNGTSFATFSVTNSGLPAKLAEQVGSVLTTTGTGNSGSYQLTLASVNNLLPNMFLVAAGYLSTGTFIVNISGNVVTLNQTISTTMSSTPVVASYAGTVGQNALNVVTGSGVSTASPSWVNFTSFTGTTVSTGGVATTGSTGIPYIPGQSYTLSAYIYSNATVTTTTPVLFQLRSVGGNYNAAVNASYLGGTTSGTTSSIDAGQSNGFFVRQGQPAPLTGYGASVTTSSSGTNAQGATTITLTSTANLVAGMTVSSSVTGLASGVAISSIVNSTQIVIGIALTAALPASTSITFGTPTGSQFIPAGWRRVSTTFTTPAIAATLSNGTYAYGSTPQFVYPVILFQQPSTTFWIDNVQLELGGTPTTWQPPIYGFETSMVLSSYANTTGNLETAHRPVRVTPGTTYSASMWVYGSGTANQYRPINAFIEWLDADYNVVSRSVGPNMFLGFTGYAANATEMPAANYGARVGVNGAVAPVATTSGYQPVGAASYARVGFSVLNGAQSATAGNIQYNMLYPVLEASSTATFPKRPDGATIYYEGQTGASRLISGWTLAAEGGGGGGTYNSNNIYWMFGIQGANNGGHAAYNGTSAALALAGGGGGSLTPGQNGQSFLQSASASTTMNWTAGWQTTAAYTQPAFPQRGNNGGFAIMNTGNNNTNIPGYAGDGGQGTVISGLNSGSLVGVALGGGGGGAGWSTWSVSGTNANIQGGATNLTTPTGAQFNPYMTPGRGTAGGGKGGGNFIVDLTQSTITTWGSAMGNYFARGIDAIANTGAGGGGGSTNFGQAPDQPILHFPANLAVSYEAASPEYYKWLPLYNATDIEPSSAAAIVSGSNGLRVTVQDDGNFKITTMSQTFQILPRTVITIPTLAARLTSSPTSTINSPVFSGTTKRVRPTIRWKDQTNTIIREDRPLVDIVFTAVNTTNYLGVNGTYTQIGGWTTLAAPSNAYLFDVTWEGDYFDAGDIVDLDMSGLAYLGYNSNGGNGSYGLAIIRWFDKQTF